MEKFNDAMFSVYTVNVYYELYYLLFSIGLAVTRVTSHDVQHFIHWYLLGVIQTLNPTQYVYLHQHFCSMTVYSQLSQQNILEPQPATEFPDNFISER